MEVSDQFHVLFLPLGKELLVPTGQQSEWAPEAVCMWWWRQRIPTPARKWTMVVQPV